jgi:hypothetical protein
MESMSESRNVQSFAQLTVDRNLICVQNTFHAIFFLQYYHPVLIFAYVCVTSYVSTFLFHCFGIVKIIARLSLRYEQHGDEVQCGALGRMELH